MNTIDQQITEQFGKIIKKFPIFQQGWEMDGYGYIVASIENVKTETFSGPLIRPKLILTNHARPYIADSSELRKKIVEYQNMIGETIEVLKLLEE
jgi:hypothetical protein